MTEYYHYTLESNVSSILKKGIYSDDPCFTTNEYFDAEEAGREVGVMPHNIDCVLKFKDDNHFIYCGIVQPSRNGVLFGGAPQFRNEFKPKPIAKRNICSRTWKEL